MKQEIITNSAEETRLAAAALAKKLKTGDVVLLQGNLGAGKTVFVKGILEAMGFPPDEVRSPTFTLVREYKSKLNTVFHLDLYRIQCGEELFQMGYEDYIHSPRGISLIEWAEKIDGLVPEFIKVNIDYLGPESRRIIIENKEQELAEDER